MLRNWLTILRKPVFVDKNIVFCYSFVAVQDVPRGAVMSWGTDVLASKMDADAEFYEKTIKPRFAQRVIAILGVFPELSVEDLKGIRYEIEWLSDMKTLRKKVEQLVRKKERKKGR